MNRQAARSSRDPDVSRRVNPRNNRQRNEALSRVPCRFYNTPTGCWRGKDCWFMHEKPISDTRGDTSASPSVAGTEGSDIVGGEASTARTSPVLESEREPIDTTCGICLEAPSRFGLMVNCSHVFCLDCIRKWRSKDDQPDDTMSEGVHKSCPTCRKHSNYVIPSKQFHLHGTPEKEAEQRKYLATTAKIPCKFFSRSFTYSRFCPYGNDCHYSHEVDGRRYVFTQRQLNEFKERREYRQRQRQREAELEGMMANVGFEGGLDEDDTFVWDLLTGLIEQEEEIYGPYGSVFLDPRYYDDDDDGFDYEFDDEDEDYPESDEEDDDDELPDLVDLPPLVDDGLPPLVDDDLPPLVDDGLPQSVDDGLPPLVDDDLPPLVDDDEDSIPDLVSDDDVHGQPDTRTRENWGPTEAQTDSRNRQPYIHLNGHHPQTNTNGSRQTSRVFYNEPPRIVRIPHRPVNNPRPQVSRNIFQRTPETPRPQPSHNPPHRLSSSSSSGVNPRNRRFSLPQHTPPPGPRRPRPPRSRQRDTSRQRSGPRGGNRQTVIYDEITWDDEDGTTETDGEISERERQRRRESEERGINARNWASRSSDLSFFR